MARKERTPKPPKNPALGDAAEKVNPHTGMPNIGRVYRAPILGRYPELRALFLKVLARYGNITTAAAAIRVSQEQAIQWRDRDPQFKRLMEAAMDEHRARIEKAIYKRAIEGWEEPRYGAGGLVGTVRRYSDQLLLAYAKRHIREYREETRTTVEGTVTHEHSVDLRQLSSEQRKALRLLLGEPDPEPVEQVKQIEAVEVEGPGKNGHQNGNGTNGHQH